MTTLEKEKPEIIDAQEIDKRALCLKLCVNIFEGLMEGYNELKENNPAREPEFQRKIEELKQQMII